MGGFMSLILDGTNGLSDVDGTAAAPAIRGTDANTGIFFPAADTIAFAEGGVESMRIDSSGNLLVGTTTTDPGIGNTNVGTQIFSGGYLASRTSGTSLFLNRNTTDGATAEFRRQGNQVGSISVTTSATAYNTSSDYRLKENIAPMTGALAKVALLKPRTYKWKVDGSDGQGFIAHELDEVVQGCVTGEKDAVQEEQYEVTPAVKDEEGNTITEAVMGTRTVPVYQGIDTSFLVATLTAAIQEQQALITALTTRITALEAA